MATAVSSAIPLRDRVYQSKNSFKHPLLHASIGRMSKYKHWDEDKMNRAYKAVNEGMSIRRAADEYGIPRSTLHDRVIGKVMLGSKSGPCKYLDSDEEEELATFLSGCSAIGYSRTKKHVQVIEIVQSVVDKKGINATVSVSWWKSFHSRHKDLTLRQPEILSHARVAGGDNCVLGRYFDLLEKTISEAGLTDRPCQIFNLDESGFPLSPKPPKVITKKGEKHPSCITGQDKSQITVLCCCSAGGYAIPPLVIFDRKTLKPELTEGEVPGTMYGLSSSGWMDAEIFEAWFANHFLVYVPPILLLMDGHASHFSPLFVNRAIEEDIIVFCLPPNSTHKTQPLDKGVFGPLKRTWREECHTYVLTNPGKVVTKYSFSSVFKRAWMKSMIPSNILGGFKTTGIYPTNRYAVIPKNPEKSPPSICKRTKLFVPLFTPVRQSHHSQIDDTSVVSAPLDQDENSSSSTGM